MRQEVVFEIRFPNTMGAMQEMIHSVEEGTWFRKLPQRSRTGLLLILDELVSNQVRYAGENVTVDLSVELSGSVLTIALCDDGIAFDPRSAPAPPDAGDLEELAIGGRGIQMVKESVASLDYRRENGWNRVDVRFAFE